jgi:hypothetical protein
LAGAIEEKRVVHPFPGKVVEPTLAVVQVPEGHPRNDIGVLAEEAEELCVPLSAVRAKGESRPATTAAKTNLGIERIPLNLSCLKTIEHKTFRDCL